MAIKKVTHALRRRNISWEEGIDSLAQTIASNRKVGKRAMTVSELLTRLIVAEGKRKRGIAHLNAPSLNALSR